MPPASVPAKSPSALDRWLPALGLLLWLAGAVGGWLLARRAGWGAGELVLAGAGWMLVLLVAARQLLRDLFGPVFTYEVMRVGRRTSTFVFRWIYIGLLVGLLALLYYAWSHNVRHYGDRVPPVRMAEFATLYFQVVAVAQFVVVVLLTPGYVAAAISNEKERQTLEFLLATDLRNREIVFGKLAARAITLCMYVLAGLPLIAFLQLFGGIDPDMALASAAASVLVVFGLSAVSLMFSTAAKKSRDAIAVTYLVVIGYIAVSLTVAIVVHEMLVRKNAHLTDLGLFVIDWGAVADWFAAGNPLWTYPNETRGRTVDGDIIARLLGRFALFWGTVTVLCLGYAVTRLRTIALRQSHGTARTGKATVAANRPEMGNEPVLWREVFGGSKRVGVMGWLFRTVIVGLVAFIPAYGAYVCFVYDRPWNPTFASQWEDYVRGMSVWVRVCTGVLTGLALFAVALRGAAAVAGERDKDTWISLISAPLTPQTVLAGKFMGCVLSVRFLYWVLIGVWAVGLGLGAVHPLMLFVTAGLVALYVSAFSLAGIVCSLWAKTTLGASVRALIGAALMAGGFWLFFLVCCVLPVEIGGGGGRTLDIPATLLMGGTPPFMAGWAPMKDFDREGLGPFHPREFENGVGPAAPVIGTVVWIGITLLLAVLALQMMTKEMNRQPMEPPPPRPRPREKATRVTE